MCGAPANDALLAQPSAEILDNQRRNSETKPSAARRLSHPLARILPPSRRCFKALDIPMHSLASMNRARLLAAIGWLTLLPALAVAAEPSGEQVFKTKCATCHGPRGEGTKRYKKRLEGDRSVAQLA